MKTTLLKNIKKLMLFNVSTFNYSTAPNERIYIEIISKDSFNWPETQLGELEPQDRRFPLPGIVGAQNQPPKKNIEKIKANYNADILVEPLKHEQQYNIIQQFIDINTPMKKKMEVTDNISLFENFKYSVQECPFLLKHDLQILLRANGLFNYKLTVISFYQKHNRDSYDELYKQFIDSATQICDSLFSAGFWSSYIDPYFNQPYSEHQINRKQYDIDSLYKNFTVDVQKFGNCQVTRYKKLNSNHFVGCLVTTAPSHHPLILFFSDKIL